MRFQPSTPAAYRLLHEGSLVMAEVEETGVLIDLEYTQRTYDRLGKKIGELEADLRSDDVYKRWSKHYGKRMKLDSNKQLARILYDDLGFKDHSGRRSTDKQALERIDLPFIKSYRFIKKLKKIRKTYINGILKHVADDGRIHPSLDWHLVVSFRGNCSDPNLQNVPIRDKISRIVRRAFIADGQLMEIDLSGAEVRVGYCYHHDPNMGKYLAGGGDMHKDAAQDLFFLKEVPDAVRQTSKNGFVFPEFYGSYYAQVAKAVWEQIGRLKLTNDKGLDLYEHLERKGIRELGKCDPEHSPAAGTFERHVQKCEEILWKKRFKVFDAWRKKRREEYLRDGFVHSLTGFTCVWGKKGLMGRNDITNYETQGSSAHCLLWCLIQLHKWLRKNRMKSKIVNTIHDSILLDVHPSEVDDVIAEARQIITVDLREHFPWLIVEMKADAALAPRGGSWADKEKVKF